MCRLSFGVRSLPRTLNFENGLVASVGERNLLTFFIYTMSRFFRQAGDSDSDSEESDDELMSSGDDEAPQRPTVTTTAKPAMSRFLRTADSDSSSSDSDEDSDNDSDAGPKRSGLPTHDDSDDEEGDDVDAPGVRIKSATERRLDEMKATGKVMENALKINDWVAISNGMVRKASAILFLILSPRIRQTCTINSATT